MDLVVYKALIALKLLETSKFNVKRSLFELYVRTCPAMFFVSSDAFSFYICSHSKAEKSIFLNSFLSLTAFARVTSFLSLSLSLAKVCARIDFDHT